MISLAWLLVLGLLTLGFDNWLAEQRNPNREVSVSATGAGDAIELERNRYGHYLASGKINGEPVEFLLDTGATDVSIPAHLADRLRLIPGPRIPVYTANGTIEVRLTELERVELGPIVLSDIAANINPHMAEDEVLLGMSFLKRLEFTQRGDILTLRLYTGEAD